MFGHLHMPVCVRLLPSTTQRRLNILHEASTSGPCARLVGLRTEPSAGCVGVPIPRGGRLADPGLHGLFRRGSLQKRAPNMAPDCHEARTRKCPFPPSGDPPFQRCSHGWVAVTELSPSYMLLAAYIHALWQPIHSHKFLASKPDRSKNQGP